MPLELAVARGDRAWIESHIPHHGRMCLLESVIAWDAQTISCRSIDHRDVDHPLRAHGRLGSVCGVEYAAQTMAVHGALLGSSGTAPGSPAGGALSERAPAKPAAGFLASVRAVRLLVLRLDDIEGDLVCEATRLFGDTATSLYEFELRSSTRSLVTGRATVVLDPNNRLNL